MKVQSIDLLTDWTRCEEKRGRKDDTGVLGEKLLGCGCDSLKWRDREMSRLVVGGGGSEVSFGMLTLR